MLRPALAAAQALILTLACALAPGTPIPDPVLAGDARVTLLQTTDIHAGAQSRGPAAAGRPGPEGGYARISAYVNAVRASAGHPVLLVDSGDWSMGTPYDLTLGDKPLPLWFLDALGYDCATLGNHEFDYGPGGLARILGAARAAFGFRTPLVASNLDAGGSAELAPLLGPGKPIAATRVTVLANGLRVGFLGLMGRDAAQAAPAAAPARFLDFGRDAGRVQDQVDDLRGRQRCHLVIALSHAGTGDAGQSGEDVDLARRVTGIDVIASGHTHTPLPTAIPVANGAWRTWIVCAGAFGTRVARADFTYHAAGRSLTLDAAQNLAMTDASLAALDPRLDPDPAVAWLVGSVDAQLNASLQPLFTQVAGFSDYTPGQVATGLYHPVAVSAQDLMANGSDPVRGPNGLGNLCADAVRAVASGLLEQTLRAQGWNGSAADPQLAGIRAEVQAAGCDPNPYAGAVVATGVIRAGLPAGVPLTFADLYNVLPLGLSPDLGQPLLTGYPILSVYLTLADLRTLFGFQLVAQTNLASSDFYLNLSGLRASLKPKERETYFQFATAAAVLGTTRERAVGGSALARAALGAVGVLASDQGAALLGARRAGNPYAAALVDLAAVDPGPAGLAGNLATLTQVAAAAGPPAGTLSGGHALSALVVAQAVAAVDEVAAFGPDDPACTGVPVPLPLAGAPRYRLAADLYAVLMLGAAATEFGTAITPYRAATGVEVLSASDLSGALANRVSLAPPGQPVRELKGWMALLGYLRTPPAAGGMFVDGRIGADYASSADFTQFGSFGAAVQVRAASYPLVDLGRLMATLARLRAAP